MRVIRRVEYFDVNESRLEYMAMDQVQPVITSDNCHIEPMKAYKEVIRGVELCNQDGCVVIGATEEVQDILGLPFDVFESQKKTISSQMVQIQDVTAELFRVKHELNEFKNLGIWAKIKAVLFHRFVKLGVDRTST